MSPAAFAGLMEKTYNCRCASCASIKAETNEDFSLDDEELLAVLRQIYDRDFDITADIQRVLWEHTRKFLDKAVDTAFKLSYKENKDFVEQLKYNNAVFAAFKTHRQQNDLAALLVDDEGKPRSFNDFRKAAEPVIAAYNVNWLETEYVTAIRSGRTAELFKRYERDKDLYPNVRWLPSRAADPRVSHMSYYNQVRSLKDKWWQTHYPGCLWNCQCDTENTNDKITHVGDRLATESEKAKSEAKIPDTVSKGLDQNPAFSGSIFSKTHPYIAEADEAAREAVRKFIKKEVGDGKTDQD